MSKTEHEFPAVVLSREDLEAVGFLSDIDDETMKKIASKLGDRLVEYGGYWEILESVCEYYNIPKDKVKKN